MNNTVQIPVIDTGEYMFGTTKHLKKMFLIPSKYKNPHHPATKFIMNLIVKDWDQEKWDILKPRQGVDKVQALRVIHSLLMVLQNKDAPKLNHVVAGAAMLLDKWFII